MSRKHTNFELDVHAPWILSMPPPDSYAGSDGSAPLAINNLVGAFTEVTTLTALLCSFKDQTTRRLHLSRL